MKACSLCGTEKNESEFYVRKETGTLRRECKECLKEKARLTYDPKSSKEACRQYYNSKRAQVAEYNRQQASLKRAYVAEIKRGSCVDCGQTFPEVVMDFDHVPGRGQKLANISRMVNGTYSLETLKAEIAKCDLVCSNCHRIRSSSRKWTREHGPLHPRKNRC